MSMAHLQKVSRHLDVVFEDEISLLGQQRTEYTFGVFCWRGTLCVRVSVRVCVRVCIWRKQLCHVSLGVVLLFGLRLLDSPGFQVMFHCWGWGAFHQW